MSISAVFPLGRSVTIAENRRGEASQRRGNRSDGRLRRTRFPLHDSGHAHRCPKAEAEGIGGGNRRQDCHGRHCKAQEYRVPFPARDEVDRIQGTGQFNHQAFQKR